MPTLRVDLTDEQVAFIEGMVADGTYRDADEAVRDALRGWQQRWNEDELKRAALREAIMEGIEALERGDYVEVDDAGLDALIQKLGAE